MKIVLNGNSEEVAEGSTLATLLEAFNLEQSLIVSELNGEIIKKEAYATTTLHEGDILEIIKFVGGG